MYLPNKKETRKSLGKTSTQVTKINCAILINTILSTAVKRRKKILIN